MLALLLACAAPPESTDSGTPIEQVGGPPADTGPTEDSPERLFRLDYVHTVQITLDATAWDGLVNDPYTYVSGDIRLDGDTLEEVGIRLRGKYGSFRSITGKPKFKIAFDEFNPGQRYRGLETLAFNNEVVDCSYLKEPLGYEVFRMAGIAAPRTGFAEVTVNGDSYGLYVLAEFPDEPFLEDRFPRSDGNLYDGKYLLYDDWSYTLLDFNSGVDDLFPLEEGVADGNLQIHAVSEAIAASAGTATWRDVVGGRVDWNRFHSFETAEQWIGHIDGYAMNRNNYRVYFDPADGKAVWIPWDLDYAFLEDYAWGMSWTSPAGQVAANCWQDSGCVSDHRAAVDTTLAKIDADGLLARIDAMDQLTLELAEADPRRECARQRIHKDRDALREWVAARSDSLRSFWSE